MFVLVEVCVSAHAFAGRVGVSQQPVGPVKGVIVAVLCNQEQNTSSVHPQV